MITSFTTSRENATSTDNGMTLHEPGKYIVTIKEADTYERSGFQFVRLLLETDDKRTATVELCVAGGNSNWQAKLFDAVCVCVGAENPQFVPAKIKNHRRGIVNQTIVQGYRCKALEQKRLGVLLQRLLRDYKNTDGEIRDTVDLVLYKPFDPATERTASEIIQGVTTPQKLAAAIEGCMKDRDIRKGGATPAPAPNASVSAADTAPAEEEPPF